MHYKDGNIDSPVRFKPAGEPATFSTFYSGFFLRSNTCSKANVKHLIFPACQNCLLYSQIFNQFLGQTFCYLWSSLRPGDGKTIIKNKKKIARRPPSELNKTKIAI